MFDPAALLTQYGLFTGGLIVIVLSFYFELVVPGGRFKRTEKEKDKYLQVLLDLAGIGRSAMTIAEKHITRRDEE